MPKKMNDGSTSAGQQSHEYVHNQVKFLSEQLRALQGEVDSKEMTIQKIMLDKSEYAKKFDLLEIQNGQLMDTVQFLEREKEEYDKVNKNLQLIVTAQNLARKTLSPRRRDCSPQDQMILEEDGVACFDLDVLGSDAQEDLRLSLGLSQRPGGQSELLYDAQGKPMKRRKRDKKYDSSITMSLHSKISPVMKTNNPPFTAGESEIQKVCMTNEHCSEADILSQLERSRQEYDEIQKQKQQIERSK